MDENLHTVYPGVLDELAFLVIILVVGASAAIVAAALGMAILGQISPRAFATWGTVILCASVLATLLVGVSMPLVPVFLAIVVGAISFLWSCRQKPLRPRFAPLSRRFHFAVIAVAAVAFVACIASGADWYILRHLVGMAGHLETKPIGQVSRLLVDAIVAFFAGVALVLVWRITFEERATGQQFIRPERP